jgi:hypothetical protein
MPPLLLTLLKRLSGLLLALFTVCAFAAEPPVQTPPVARGAAGREPINSVCPVSGNAGSVGKPAYGDYHGQNGCALLQGLCEAVSAPP